MCSFTWSHQQNDEYGGEDRVEIDDLILQLAKEYVGGSDDYLDEDEEDSEHTLV